MLRRLLLLMMLSLLMCGCSRQEGEEITFSSWGSVSEVKILKNVINDFEAKNPDINVKFIHIPQNYFQKIHLLFASNTAPDVIFINNLYLPVYESKLEDLTELIKKEDFYPQAIEGLSYEGKVLAIPRDVSNLVFYVNKDILKKQGISFPKESWTLEDLVEILDKVSSNERYGVSYEDDIYWVLPYLNYFGGGILYSDDDLIIDTDKSQKGIDFYKSLKNKGYAPTKAQVGSSTLAQMFLNGKICFYLSGRWMYPKISETADFDWAVINFPYGEVPAPCDSSGWAISKSSQHKESAYKFVKYISSKESIDAFTDTGLIVPARIDSSQKLNSTNHNENVFLGVVKNSKKTQVNKNYKKITDEINLKLNL